LEGLNPSASSTTNKQKPINTKPIIMSFTKVEMLTTPNVPKRVSIKTYFDSDVENMGLEQYGMVLYDGVIHTEQLACLEVNGIKRYLTGLNEFAPEIKLLPEEERIAKSKEIRTVVAMLERDLAANILDVDDKDFWNNVKLLRPDNSEFWDKIELSTGNDATFLDPTTNPYDMIKVFAIAAGGFSMVARSYEAAQAMAKPPKFYLDKYEETVTTKNATKKLRNRALAELQKMYDKNSNKLLYVVKVIDPGSTQYRKSTPNDVIYEAMDEYINGNSFESNKERAAETFLSTSKTSMEDLKLRSLVKDATYYKEIINKSDGFLHHRTTQTMLGRNVSDVMEYLKNPVNDEILRLLMEVVEVEWNK